MVFDFATQPPELISAKIYSGPGSETLQSAAAAWDTLASELQSSATQFKSTISGLAADWTGPSSEAAAAAAAPYVSWLSTTAGQAEETAGQARAAAGAYETALAGTVPPAEITANRAQLLQLVPANIFGQYNSAIAALEAEYAQFWAQNVAAITSYSASSQSATAGLGSFTEAPQTTNPSGQATQAAATTAAGAAAAPNDLESILEQFESTATNFLNQVTAVNADYTKFATNLLGTIPGGSTLATTWTNFYSFVSGAGSQATWTNVVNSSSSLGIGQWKNFFIYQPWSHGVALGSLNGGLSSPGGHLGAGLGAGARAATAALGSAQTVGTLSVPPSWAGATPAIRLAATSLPDGAFAATASPTMEVPLNALNQASLGSLAGGALGSPASRVVASTGVRAKVTAPRKQGPVPLDKVIAKLQESPDDVQHWNVDEAGLDDLVAKLSTKPGIHAVHLTDGKAPATAAKAATEIG